jgi:hypothetical protein
LINFIRDIHSKLTTPLIGALNPAPPAAEAAVTDPPPEEPTVAYQPPSRDELHQDWPLDPNARAPIVAGLLAMTQRGATKTYITEDGETVTVKLKPRESLRAMRTLNALGRMSLRQQKRDRQAKVHNGQKTLNDLVSPANSVAAPRMEAEAQRQGLPCPALLDRATRDAILAQAEQEHIAVHGPIRQTGPKPMKPTAPERRNDWIIPKDAQAQIMNRLQDMVNPNGEEYQELRPHEYLSAVQVLVMYCRLVDEQEQFDRQVATGEEPFDWEAYETEVVQKIRQSYETQQQKQEDPA